MTAALGSDRPVAVVTGGARRVGRAICLELAQSGCDIALTYRTSEPEALETAAMIEALGVRVRTDRLDLERPEEAQDYAQRIERESRRLDVLVHNASVYEPCALADTDTKRMERDYRVHCVSPTLLTSTLAGRLCASELQGGGAVVVMCDIHAMGLPRSGFASYSASKAAAVELVRTLAVELAPGARCNGVAPGVVAWPDAGYESDAPTQERYLERVPLQRSGTPEEAARLVRFLALEATYTTGHIVPIDGGRRLR